MSIWVFDLDMVLQKPAYPHQPDLIADIAAVVERPYGELFQHYVEQHADNQAEEEYHLSLCRTEDQKSRVRGFWRKLHENMPRATIIPGAKGLLEEVASHGGQIYSWTKGSVEIQRKRLESIGLSRFFAEGHIIHSPRKGTIAGFEQDLIPQLPYGRKIMIGDSYEQDIQPALGVDDIVCVWIRWDQEVPKDVDLNSPNLIIVESTQELVTKIKEGLLDVQGDH